MRQGPIEQQLYPHLITLLAVSAGMVGVCLTAISLIGIFQSHSKLDTALDEILSVDALPLPRRDPDSLSGAACTFKEAKCCHRTRGRLSVQPCAHTYSHSLCSSSVGSILTRAVPGSRLGNNLHRPFHNLLPRKGLAHRKHRYSGKRYTSNHTYRNLGVTI